MRMPQTLDTRLLAPCGVNCAACYKHLAERKSCPGCWAVDSQNKPAHCHTCKTKACAEAHGVQHCFRCEAFPCALNKRMERSYKNYHVSVLNNLRAASECGLSAFMQAERERWQCSCGGIVSQHDSTCSECGKEAMKTLTDMPNISTVTADKLTRAGIDTPDKLREIGSKQALIMVRAQVDDGACLSMLRGLEGAIRGVRWHDLPDDIKEDLRVFHKSL